MVSASRVRKPSTMLLASRRKASAICDSARGESAFATAARTRVCLGGSSVSSSSGRTEFGSCQGREVDEKLFQSLRPATTCSKRASIVMSSRGSLTTGANPRSRSSTARAFRTDSRENGSVSNSGIALGIYLSRGGKAAIDMKNFAVDERRRAAEQERAGPGVVLFAAEPAQRYRACATFVFSLVVEPQCAWSRHRTRCDGVDAHVARSEFGSQNFGERDDGAFHETVGRRVGETLLRHG